MSKPGNRENVLQLGRETSIGIRGIGVVRLRPVGRLYTEEGSIVSAFGVNQRYQTEICQLLFTPVRDRNFGRTLKRNIPLIRPEGMDRQPAHEPATLNSPDGCGPVIL